MDGTGGLGDDAGLGAFGAIILAGGQATRLGGFDKASVEIDGRTLLDLALDAVVDAAEVVVVGHPVPTERPVTFVLEEPRHGGPVAGLLTGRAALLRRLPTLVVVAVDMPRLTHATVRRLQVAAVGHDGAVLVDDDGHRQLALVLRTAALDRADPGLEARHGMAVRALLGGLDLAAVPAVGREARDVDTWADLRDLREPPTA